MSDEQTFAAPAGGWRAVLATLPPVVLCLLLYFPTLGSDTPFESKGEAREALVVQSMLAGGVADWILPFRPGPGGEEVASKPPFYHWLVAGWVRASGTSLDEWSARLPSALLATVTVGATAAAGALAAGPVAGIAAGTALTLNLEWLRTASDARVDMTLTAMISLALLVAYRDWVKGGLTRAGLSCFAVLSAMAVWTKGPIGWVIPFGTLFCVVALARDLRGAREAKLVRAVAIAGALGLVWYVAASVVGGREFLERQVLSENLYRFLPVEDTTVHHAGHRHPFWFYVPAVLGGFAPWSLLLVPVGWAIATGRLDLRDRRVAFPLVWVAFDLLVHSAAAGKRSVYVLGAYPGLALLVGLGVTRAVEQVREPRRWMPPAARGLAVLGGALAVGVGVAALLVAAGVNVLAPIAPLLHPMDRANLPWVRELIAARALLWVGVAAALGACAFGLARSLPKARLGWAFACLAGATLAVLLGIQHAARPELATSRSFRGFVAQAVERIGATPLCVDEASFDFGLRYYLGSGVPTCAVSALPEGPLAMILWDWRFENETPATVRDAFRIVRESDTARRHGRERVLLVVREVAPPSAADPGSDPPGEHQSADADEGDAAGALDPELR